MLACMTQHTHASAPVHACSSWSRLGSQTVHLTQIFTVSRALAVHAHGPSKGIQCHASALPGPAHRRKYPVECTQPSQESVCTRQVRPNRSELLLVADLHAATQFHASCAGNAVAGPKCCCRHSDGRVIRKHSAWWRYRWWGWDLNNISWWIAQLFVWGSCCCERAASSDTLHGRAQHACALVCCTRRPGMPAVLPCQCAWLLSSAGAIPTRHLVVSRSPGVVNGWFLFLPTGHENLNLYMASYSALAGGSLFWIGAYLSVVEALNTDNQVLPTVRSSAAQ